MNSGFYNAAIQMSKGSVLDMEVHTENLAHSTMPGYKRLDTSHTAFADVLESEVDGSKQASSTVAVNHSQGALRGTQRPLDFAIDGEGFFVVSDGTQEFYTRNGNFRVGSDGSVVNSLGMRLQTSSGDLTIPAGSTPSRIEIDEGMNITIGERNLGLLRIDAFEDPSKLEQAGTTLFVNNGSGTKDAECSVINGFLEQSNTAIFEEMVGMMTTMRNYEACQKMLQTVDDVEKQMMSKIV